MMVMMLMLTMMSTMNEGGDADNRLRYQTMMDVDGDDDQNYDGDE